MWVTPWAAMTSQNRLAELWLQHHGAARAQHRPYRPALGVDVEKRQITQVGVVGTEVDVGWVDLATPQHVGVRVHHRLGLGRGARGEHDAHRPQRIRVEGGHGILVAGDRVEALQSMIELVVRRRLARVVVGANGPRQVRSGLGDHRRELRLSDGTDGARVLDEVAQFGGDAAGVGGHRHAAQAGDRVPGNDGLRAVLGVDQHRIANADAALAQAGSHLPGRLGELAVGPGAHRPALGFPHQEGVIAPVCGALIEQPAHVLTVELIAGHRFCSDRRDFDRIGHRLVTPRSHRFCRSRGI